ncbi:MAG: flagellar biosynthetic protein FliO [Candidatus Margulisiibacteriota bacterium]|jgi:flagellar biogenesis protein FliO
MPIHYYIQLVITLACLIAILIIVLNVVKFVNKQRYLGGIKIVDRLPIDNNYSILVIEAEDTKYILGLGNKPIYVLDKIQIDHVKSNIEESIDDYI